MELTQRGPKGEGRASGNTCMLARKAREHLDRGGVPKAGTQQDRHWEEKDIALQLWRKKDR